MYKGCTYGVLMYCFDIFFYITLWQFCYPVNYLENNMVSLFDELKKFLLQDDIPQLL